MLLVPQLSHHSNLPFSHDHHLRSTEGGARKYGSQISTKYTIPHCFGPMGGSLHCVLSSKRGGSSRDARRHGLCHVEGLFLGIVEELLNDSPRSCSYKLLVTNRLNNPVCGQGLGIRICTVKYHAQKVMARTNGRRKISLISDQREALSEALSRKFQHWTRETLSVRKGFNLGNFNTGHGKRCQFGKGSIWKISSLGIGNAVRVCASTFPPAMPPILWMLFVLLLSCDRIRTRNGRPTHPGQAPSYMFSSSWHPRVLAHHVQLICSFVSPLLWCVHRLYDIADDEEACIDQMY